MTRLAPLVPAERTLVLTNASLAPRARAAAASCRATTSSPSRGPPARRRRSLGGREIARRGGRDAVMILRARGLGDRRRRAFRAALARAADGGGARTGARDRRHRPDAPRSGLRLHPARRADRGSECSRSGSRASRGAVRREAEPRRAAERWCAMAFSGTPASSSGAPATFSTRAARTRRRSGRRCSLAHAGDIDAFFAGVTPISVDVGVLERSARVLVVAGDFGWDDVGTWAALRRVRRRDAAGNATFGEVHSRARRTTWCTPTRLLAHRLHDRGASPGAAPGDEHPPTALLLDLLDSLAASGGLGDSLRRARQHLTGQIEAGGRVRYHGLHAPGIGTLGCASNTNGRRRQHCCRGGGGGGAWGDPHVRVLDGRTGEERGGFTPSTYRTCTG